MKYHVTSRIVVSWHGSAYRWMSCIVPLTTTWGVWTVATTHACHPATTNAVVKISVVSAFIYHLFLYSKRSVICVYCIYVRHFINLKTIMYYFQLRLTLCLISSLRTRWRQQQRYYRRRREKNCRRLVCWTDHAVDDWTTS